MPRPHRTHRTRTGLDRLDHSQAQSLLRSSVFDRISGCWPSEEARPSAWKLHRDALLRYWIQDSQNLDVPRCLASTNIDREASRLTPAGPFHRPRA